MSNIFSVKYPLRSVRLAVVDDEEAGPSATELHEQALEQARREGYEAGRRDAETAYKEALQQVRDFQTSTLHGLLKQQKSLFTEAEQALPELILEGVHRIINNWAPTAAEIEGLVREILEGLESEAEVRVFLNPGDKKQMISLHPNLEKDFPGVAILEDARLRSGECYARGRFGITDGRFSAKLENLRKVFV